MTELKIIVPGPEVGSDAEMTVLWYETGNFIGTVLARMERDKAFTVMLGRLLHDIRDAWGGEAARKVLQACVDTME